MMKRISLVCLCAVMCVANALAAQWIDVTGKYVANPNYDGNNLDGWDGTPLGAYNPLENAEHYQKNYDTYQVITGLKAGTYRVSLSAFYRMGDANSDYSKYTSADASLYQYAQLYATSSVGDYYTQIAAASSAALSQPLDGDVSFIWGATGGLYIPNNMVAAHFWFEAGHYRNTVECEVGDDGELRIGIRKSQTVNGDWTCIDTWTLEYYGEPVKITAITFPNKEESMFPTEQRQFTCTISPDDATNTTLTWTSTNTSVATVDENGLVTAKNIGTAIIRAKATDGSYKTSSFTLKVVPGQTPTAENCVINELMTSNVDVYRDPSTNFGSWVEVYNPTDDVVNLGGMYITDDLSNLTKNRLQPTYGSIPAHGFGLLHFDHFEVWTQAAYRQIDDKLDADGGVLYFTDGTQVVNSIEYPAGISRMSYARTTDGGDEWSYTSNPTPGTSNQAGGGFASVRLGAPVVDAAAGLFSGTKSVNVEIPAGATLRYTTDGTTPTLANGSTSANGNFSVSNTTCFRFRLFQDGYLPSPVVTRSYIKDNGNEPFPIISLVTDKKHISEGEYAIFVYSDNGRPGAGQSSKYNANMDWDRPVNFEYITTDNECVVSQECDYSACGGWSRAWSPHSFKLKAGKIYEGKNSFDYQFFAEKPFLKHKTLQIRNGGNDNGCRIKDAAITQVVGRSGLYVEYQSWQPVHVYLNGQNYGVLNMREPNNKHYAQTNYGIDTDEMDQFEISPDSGYVQMTGTREAFDRLYSLAKNAADEATYAEICNLLDVDEYANYMAVELYVGNTDWPQNNVKGFRSVEDGKFRFVIFDTDHGLQTSEPLTTFFSKQNYTWDSRYGYDWSQKKDITGTRLQMENPFITLFKNMLQNDSFRRKFTDAFCIVGGSVYTPERTYDIITEMKDYLSQGGYVNPTNTANTLINGFRNRLSGLIYHLMSRSEMKLSSVNPQDVTLASNYSDAGLLINGMDVPTGKFNGKLFAPVTLTAKAPAGYAFQGWKNAGTTNTVASTVFATDTPWKYYQASLDNKTWYSSTYNDASWRSGNAPLGYGKTQNTVLTSNKLCYYFRKSFNIEELKEDDVFTLNYTLDDGCVVYVNGVEAGRDNMPSGKPTYSTAASTYAYNNPNTGSMTLSASLFKEGANVIAVEVHNNSTSSTDILWNAELVRQTTVDDASLYVSTDSIYEMPSAGAQNLIAVWKRISDEEKVVSKASPIKINEVSAGNISKVNELFKKDDWVELYNTTDTDLDCAGLYISDNESKPQKYQIPSSPDINTVIPAHGHLIVWCSKREAESQLHASFKLSNTDGSLVMLSSSDEFVANNRKYFDAHPALADFTDKLYYDAHAEDQTVGRYPDGSNDYYVMNCATIGKSNTLLQSDVFVKRDAFRPARTAFLLGDADGDGTVTMSDANLVVNCYLGVSPMESLVFKAADVDGDGNITMSDANGIVNIYLGE